MRTCGLTSRSSGLAPAFCNWAPFHSCPIAACRREPLNSNVMRPLNEPFEPLHLTAFGGRARVPMTERWSISRDVDHRFCSSLVRMSTVVPGGEMLRLSKNAPLLTLEASLALVACGQAAPLASPSATKWRQFAHNRRAASVGAAHNKSFERTRTGILQLGIISFLPNRSLPPRAAQLQR